MNPIMNLIQMAMNGNDDGVTNFAQNFLKNKKMNFNSELEKFKEQHKDIKDPKQWVLNYMNGNIKI